MIYAEDVTVLCPSLNGQNVMLSPCTDFAKGVQSHFQCSERLLVFTSARLKFVVDLLFSLVYLYNTEWETMRNILVTSHLSDAADCAYKWSCFIGQANRLTADFNHVD